MIVNLWSTPRTGSNWYAKYLQKQFNLTVIKQYLNEFHFINYYKPNYSDYVYEYEDGCLYQHYYYDALKECIAFKPKISIRNLNKKDEESYRLNLLGKHNYTKNPILFYNHVLPMSDIAYKTLYNMATKNIFLYRKNLRRQISSYALAYGTKQYKPNFSFKTYSNIEVDNLVLKNLYDRIIYWYNLDKTNCQVVAYEDIDFNFEIEKMPKKQNEIDPFLQLSHKTQNYIMKLEEEFSNYS